MLAVKLVGVGVVALCSCGVWAETARRDRESLSLGEGFISVLRYIRNEVDHYLTPQTRIFQKCDIGLLTACGWSAARAPRDVGELCRSAEGRVDARMYGTLLRFADSFGTGFRDDQLKLCDACGAELERQLRSLCDELPRRRRASMSLGICTIAAVAVILF